MFRARAKFRARVWYRYITRGMPSTCKISYLLPLRDEETSDPRYRGPILSLPRISVDGVVRRWWWYGGGSNFSLAAGSRGKIFTSRRPFVRNLTEIGLEIPVERRVGSIFVTSSFRRRDASKIIPPTKIKLSGKNNTKKSTAILSGSAIWIAFVTNGWWWWWWSPASKLLARS